MPQTHCIPNQNTETVSNFSMTSSVNLEGIEVPEDSFVLIYRDEFSITDTRCDPDVIACFLGLTREGHFSPGIIFELFNVPLSDLQALLLLGFFVQLEDAELSTDELFSEWMSCTFDSRFNAGYNALSQLMNFHDLEMPPTIELLRHDSVAVQSALDSITFMMTRIDGPLNKAMEEMPDLENAEGLLIEVDFTPDEEDDDDEEEEEEVPF